MTIQRVGIIGAGTMGGGIATNAAQHGMEVLITDASAEIVEKAQAGAAKFYQRSVDKGRMAADDAKASSARITAVRGIEDLASADLIIEAVFEDFEIKADLFQRLQAVRGDDALVATNTSCLRVSDLQAHDRVPQNFLGMHYFSPAQINPIVEVVRGSGTGDAAMERALAFCRATAKQPILCRDSFGFAINRFFCPYTNEAVRAMDDGLGTPGQIDLVAKDALGLAAGPFQVMNLIKPRINLHAIRNLAPLGGFYAPAASMIKIGEAEESWVLDDDEALPEDQACKVTDMLRAGVFVPVLQALDEDVAEPAAFDLGATQALKMGRPPCALMDELGQAEVERIIEPALTRFGLSMPASVARVGSLI